jgi:hypothetical protein
MRDYSSQTEKHSDPRPRYVLLGTDSQGADHVYYTRRERVVVIADGRVEWVQPLDGASVADWVDHIDDVRDWADCRYGVDRQYAELGERVRAARRREEVAD